MRHLYDLFHARLDDIREVLHRDLFGRTVAYARYGHQLVRTGLFGDSLSKTRLQLLGLLRQHHKPLLDIVRYDIAAERYYRCMADDVIVEDRNIRSTATDIDEANTGFLLLVVQYGKAGRQRFQDKIGDLETSATDTFVDVIDSVGLSRYDMEVRFQTHTRHAHRLLYTFFVINHVVLRHHVNDLAARRHHHAVHVLGEAL